MPRFSEPHWPGWQARKYSVGREGSGLAQVGDIAPPSITAPSMVDL
ncbi:hypothetical protein NK6_10030 [Bradyrhizobium diazoefficiens]|uniref:Uncharacterized protein n=1 Tax=Bradyrhizobium diazoefficiens TaxID=1355477 RepID=A0A0E4G0G9_9BRAD|nr:hypothetical protein NK6_10030 [Bradyrhizobium diazoefficiens]